MKLTDIYYERNIILSAATVVFVLDYVASWLNRFGLLESHHFLLPISGLVGPIYSSLLREKNSPIFNYSFGERIETYRKVLKVAYLHPAHVLPSSDAAADQHCMVQQQIPRKATKAQRKQCSCKLKPPLPIR